MKIYPITATGINAVNRRINNGKNNISAASETVTERTLSFKGFEQKAFLSKMSSIMNNIEIPEWQNPFRRIMIKADTMTAFAEKYMPSGNITYPKPPQLNLNIFENIDSVAFMVNNIYIRSKNILPQISEVEMSETYIPVGTSNDEQDDDIGILVKRYVIDDDTGTVKNNKIMNFMFNGKIMLEQDSTIYYYDRKGEPEHALKTFIIDDDVQVDVHYSNSGEYDSTYFYDKMGNIIKSDKPIGEFYYKQGKPFCCVDLDGTVRSSDGYFLFKL